MAYSVFLILASFIVCFLVTYTSSSSVKLEVTGATDFNVAGCACGNDACSVSMTNSEVNGYYSNVTGNSRPFLLIQLTAAEVSCRYSIQFQYTPPPTNQLNYWSAADKLVVCTQVGGTPTNQFWQCKDEPVFSVTSIFSS